MCFVCPVEAVQLLLCGEAVLLIICTHIAFSLPRRACVCQVEAVELLLCGEAMLLMICTHITFSLPRRACVCQVEAVELLLRTKAVLFIYRMYIYIFSLNEPVFVRLKSYNS